MLVCNVSLRPPRRVIAADLAEVAIALDATTTGFVVFATLVDDPASVGDFVDAYLGEIMVEAASAADTINVGLAFDAAIVESLTASSSESATVSALTTTAWNPSDKSSGITLSNGNLTATMVSGGNSSVRSVANKTSGKYYAEYTWSTLNTQSYVGISLASTLISDMANSFLSTVMAGSNGNIHVNGGGGGSFSTSGNGDTVCIAVDFTNNRFWARTNSGNWNNSGTADPATNTGGIDISSIAWSGGTCAGCTHVGGGSAATANFGAAGFTYGKPSGFNEWT
jgi:hypothetical protein